jgi:hypothetical protein
MAVPCGDERDYALLTFKDKAGTCHQKW